MSKLLSAASRKKVDEVTISEYGIAGEELVEAAARAIEKEILPLMPKAVLIVCGYGNNGSDGLALARMLNARCIATKVYLVGKPEKATELWKRERALLCDESFISSIDEISADVIVDAIFGIGLNREITGEYRSVIEKINEYKKINGCTVISADIPSGVDADTGAVLGVAVTADKTVVMSYACPGHVLYPGAENCGKLIVADIGLVQCEKAGVIEAATTDCIVEPPVHSANTHKGSYGRIYMLTGSEGMAGASMFSAEAAYRTGCGLVYVDTERENRALLQIKVPEAVLTDWNKAAEMKMDAVVCGCGIRKTADIRSKLLTILKEFKGGIVIDADGLNLIAGDDELAEAVRANGNVVLTPHVGELSRLLECSSSEISRDLISAAKKAAVKYNAICVAKSARTVVSDGNDTCYINTYGNAGMATAGSGDVLAGVIGGLMARGLNNMDAAVLGVTTHAKAGDAAAMYLGMSHVMARDIIDNLKKVTRDWN